MRVSVSKILALTNIMVVFALFSAPPLFAAFETWGAMAEEMSAEAGKAYSIYTAGDIKGAKAQIDVVYYGYYEKYGFEKTVMAYISGARAAQVEYQFSTVKKLMTSQTDAAEVRDAIDSLSRYLREDAARLDGKNENPLGVFLGSLIIILREGFEAILIVGAIIAYLLKSGNGKSTRAVYWGALLALGASVVLAWIFNRITSIAGGQNQEIVEGVTMLTAVAVLFYVSNWMVSKAEAGAWGRYIEGKVQSSIGRGSLFSLTFAAFLAVFREGAETILFYQAMLAQVQSYINMVWLGLAAGSVLLVIVYLVIRLLSIRLPLKPFFLGTSILLFIMSISFAGNGVKELQEGNVIGVTTVPGMVSVDILGIYPTLETIIPQLVLLAVTVVTFVIQIRRWKQMKKT